MAATLKQIAAAMEMMKRAIHMSSLPTDAPRSELHAMRDRHSLFLNFSFRHENQFYNPPNTTTSSLIWIKAAGIDRRRGVPQPEPSPRAVGLHRPPAATAS